MDWPKNWKLKLRYGKLETAFHHFTLIADGEVVKAHPDFGTTEGSATFFSIKVWATDSDEAIDVIASIGEQVGFKATGEIRVYDTDPERPPKDHPYAYDLGFQPY